MKIIFPFWDLHHGLSLPSAPWSTTSSIDAQKALLKMLREKKSTATLGKEPHCEYSVHGSLQVPISGRHWIRALLDHFLPLVATLYECTVRRVYHSRLCQFFFKKYRSFQIPNMANRSAWIKGSLDSEWMDFSESLRWAGLRPIDSTVTQLYHEKYYSDISL